MTPQELYDRMKKVQEPKGYYFNKDKERTFELLEALIANKENYGYMGCPCRLLVGDKELDRDIFCPCVYSACLTSRSSAVAIVICMFPKNGMRAKFRTSMCPSAGPRKKCLIDILNPLNR